jgi:sporulation protein YlmC with PRC-barrel domain
VDEVKLVHDLLDSQVVDRRGDKLGKVDGIILRVSPRGAPRVAAIELGAVTAARRVHPRLGRWLDHAVRRWRLPLGRTRIAWSRVQSVGLEVRVDVDGRRARVQALERWLRARVIDRIPGA